MQELLSKHRITQEQLEAVTELKTTNGETYFEIRSSTGEGFYTARRHPVYGYWQDNCRWTREGSGTPCQHLRSIACYLELQASEAVEQAVQDTVQTWEHGTLLQHGNRALTMEHGVLIR